MILKWSKQEIVKDLEYVRDGDNIFRDARGKISNHELTEPINLIGLIDSKKELLEPIIIIPNKNRNVFSQKDKLLKSFRT